MSRAKPAFIPCVPPPDHPMGAIELAALAVEHNPANAPPRAALASLLMPALLTPTVSPLPQFIAVMTSKYWGPKGRAFGVTFLDNPTAACKRLILAHMNAWSEYCAVSFSESASGEVRINRGAGGYWSFLGTDILGIGSGQTTMNLQGFTEKTPDSEYHRVVRHETGHTLGCPHEHMRSAIVERLDRAKTIAYFLRTQGWTPGMTTQQVLTPIDEASLTGTPSPEVDSIMCYQLPAAITRDGQPIPGGTDITPTDGAFMGKLYPRIDKPIEPVQPIGPEKPSKPGAPATVMVELPADPLIAALTRTGATINW